ncbi:hypothetical protein B0A48_06170 [Cryoendolithus antarcticus]|uniref:Glutamyl-tRNA amidotransferase complex subunit Gta3 domain-containing protein n=1 Tax=Cryoendolithus antarcticus TaxID=1507870 RepID=A0A1V8TAA7_9PEZI|nr:hypothetical protein B0A48_06170 [Cryoendolithus antarcticus]
MALQCLPLRSALRCRPIPSLRRNLTRFNSTTPSPIDVAALLSKPTWSVTSLLTAASPSTSTITSAITSKQLHHLLRLSALPPPASEAEVSGLLASLSQHLYFVNEIQSVDTTAVEPLQGLRDETKQGEKESELGLEALKEALGKEKVVGRYHRRIRRVRDGVKGKGREGVEEEMGDVMDAAARNGSHMQKYATARRSAWEAWTGQKRSSGKEEMCGAGFSVMH